MGSIDVFLKDFTVLFFCQGSACLSMIVWFDMTVVYFCISIFLKTDCFTRTPNLILIFAGLLDIHNI